MVNIENLFQYSILPNQKTTTLYFVFYSKLSERINHFIFKIQNFIKSKQSFLEFKQFCSSNTIRNLILNETFYMVTLNNIQMTYFYSHKT